MPHLRQAVLQSIMVCGPDVPDWTGLEDAIVFVARRTDGYLLGITVVLGRGTVLPRPERRIWHHAGRPVDVSIGRKRGSRAVTFHLTGHLVGEVIGAFASNPEQVTRLLTAFLGSFKF